MIFPYRVFASANVLSSNRNEGGSMKEEEHSTPTNQMVHCNGLGFETDDERTQTKCETTQGASLADDNKEYSCSQEMTDMLVGKHNELPMNQKKGNGNEVCVHFKG